MIWNTEEAKRSRAAYPSVACPEDEPLSSAVLTRIVRCCISAISRGTPNEIVRMGKPLDEL